MHSTKNPVKRIAILGSTGSIGQQTLDVVRRFPHRFQVVGLAGGNNINMFTQQIEEFKPDMIYINSFGIPSSMEGRIATMEDIATHPDVDLVVTATSGNSGLNPTIAALKAGKSVALANKEVFVMAGALITQIAKQHRARIFPIDSEHNAIWQCIRGERSQISRLLLTASGGPFYGIQRSRLSRVTADNALKHPTWKMGEKITIDSATLLNKGMEAIEAHWLFKVPYNKIEILIHRQSIVHSMVEFRDGSIKAQLSNPDMHLPIQYALLYPQRIYNASIEHLDFKNDRNLSFEPADMDSFPCLKLALEAGNKGGTYPAALCGADEVAVELFLNKRIGFLDIERIIEETLCKHQNISMPALEDIVAADKWARETALDIIKKDLKW